VSLVPAVEKAQKIRVDRLTVHSFFFFIRARYRFCRHRYRSLLSEGALRENGVSGLMSVIRLCAF